jgi:hypothetical protein
LTFEAENALISLFRKASMKKFPFRKLIPALSLATVVSFATALSTRAQLLAYEGFDYGDNYWLGNTNNGGFGWGAAWQSGSQVIATNTAASLSYSSDGYTLLSSGGALVMGNPGGPFSTTQHAQRALAGGLGLTNYFGGNGGTIWISFLYQNWTTDSAGRLGFRQANIGLFSGATTNANGTSNANGVDRLDVGSLNTYDSGVGDYMSLWGTVIAQPYAQQSSTAVPRGALGSGGTTLVVMELVFDNTTAPDTAYVWFNPTIGGANPSISTAITTNNIDLSGVNAIRFTAGNYNASGTNAVMAIDEIRVAYTFDDMMPLSPDIPEPATSALAVPASLILLTLKRRLR